VSSVSNVAATARALERRVDEVDQHAPAGGRVEDDGRRAGLQRQGRERRELPAHDRIEAASALEDK
jgi:hypothetical protein